MGGFEGYGDTDGLGLAALVRKGEVRRWFDRVPPVSGRGRR